MTAIVWGLLLAAAASQPLVTFPGPRTSVRSPTTAARVFYVDMGADQNGQNLTLWFESGSGRPVLLERFDRSVAVGCSPSGTHFLVNDYIGSNIADCLIIRAASTGVRGVSLLRIIARSPGRPRERPYDSHYYVHCRAWLSNDVIDGVVRGHIDEFGGGHDFEYPFTYDAGTGGITWRERER